MPARKSPPPAVPPPSPEALALLRTVREHYHDDAPRLVLADYLEENGEAGRAEFIRVGVERDRHPHSSEPWQRLYLREQELIKQHEKRWLGSIRPVFRHVVGARGLFVIRQSAAKFLGKEFQAETGVWPWVSGLWFSTGSAAQIERLTFLTDMPSLWEVSFFSAKQADPEARALAACPALAGVGSLDLSLNRIGLAGVRALAESPHLANLEELDLAYSAVGDAGARALAESRHLPRLKGLSLVATGIGLEGARALAASAHLGNLERLHLSLNRLGPAEQQALRERFGERVVW